MKYLAILLVFLTGANCFCSTGITIKGNVKNADDAFITLNYHPCYRGIFSLDGFKSTGSMIGKNGNFEIKSKDVRDAGGYYLEVRDKTIDLILFDGDNVSVSFDLKDVATTFFARGKGAAKINILRLKQFSHVAFKPELTLEQFSQKNDSIISARLQLLDWIYTKQLSVLDYSTAEKEQIRRIIKESPLTEKEYTFMKMRIQLQRYAVVDFLSQKVEKDEMATVKLNFNIPVFRYFNTEIYREIKSIDHWTTHLFINNILKIEYLKEKLKANPDLTYANWNVQGNPDYDDWARNYLRKYFNPVVHDKYYGEIAAFLLTMGNDIGDETKYLDNNFTTEQYLGQIHSFRKLLKEGLKDQHYKLDSDELLLSQDTFASLLKSHQDENILLVFWSAQYAGASIINKIPELGNFEKNNDVRVINICIDKSIYKNLWAARVIDNNWKGKHYFMPIENNDKTLNEFGAEKISAFCDNGVVYCLINKKGIKYLNQNFLNMKREGFIEFIEK